MRKKLNELLSPVMVFDILAIVSFLLLSIFAGIAGMVFGLIMSGFLVLHLITLCQGVNRWADFWFMMKGTFKLPQFNDIWKDLN